MKTLIRWFKNIQWLFNHPPTSIENLQDDTVCDYCGTNDYYIRKRTPSYAICCACEKKVFDAILKKSN
jgi:hypothetical protein